MSVVFIGDLQRGRINSRREGGGRSGKLAREKTKAHRQELRNLFIDSDFNCNQQVNYALAKKRTESSSVPKWVANN